MSTKYFAVDSHHASVKVGDCAIHLLVEVTQNSGSQDTRTVHKIVLIDGGTKSLNPQLTACKNAVQSLVKKLTQVYKLKPLKFHTIVMSHWDEDHYGGLQDLIWKDMARVRDEKKNPSEILTYLYWKSVGTEEQPLTYFYCPNEAGKSTGKSTSLNGLSARFRRGSGTNDQYIEVCIDKTIPEDKDEGDWKPFAILKSAEGTKDLYKVLGVNFFENKALPSNPGAITPQQLMDQNKPQIVGWPGMYCIGVKNKTFGAAGGVDIVREGVTKTNQFSIAAVLLWANGTDPPRCSHYFAGDADEIRETAYLKWLSTGEVVKTTSMKLSHHGSRSSTPVTAYNFKPQNIIISNPTGSYFHPGWETIFFLSLLARESTETVAKAGGKVTRMWATKYPAYFAVDENGEYLNIGKSGDSKPMLSTKSFDDAKHGKAFRDFLAAKYKTYTSWGAKDTAGLDEFAVYKNWSDDKDDKRKVLMDMLKTRWANYCWPPAETYSNADTSTAKPKLKTVTTLASPESVIVTSTNDDKTDGDMAWLPYNLSEAIDATALFSKAAPASTAASKKRKAENLLNDDPLFECPWMLSPHLKRSKKEPPPEDTDLTTQVTIDKNAFHSQDGTNIDEIDHSDWEPDEEEIEDETMASNGSRAHLARLEAQSEVIPILPLPPHTPGVDDQSWYIYASTIPDAKISATTLRYTRITDESPWDGFISTLHCAVVGLEVNPAVDPQSTTTDLLADDELALWFRDVLGANDIVMIKSMDPVAGAVGGFALSLPISPLSSEITITQPEMLLFSTSAAALQNSFSGSQPPNMGLRVGGTALVMGLDLTLRAPATVTLDTLAKFVGLHNLFESSFLSVLGSLNFVLPDEKSTGAGHRNAIWFVPQESYATTVRLQLDLAQADLKTLESFLSILNGEIESGYVIARRKSIWSSDADAIASSTLGELALIVYMNIAGLSFKVVVDLTKDVLHTDLILNTSTGKTLDIMLAYLQQNIIGSDPSGDPFAFKQWLTYSAGSLSFPDFDFRRVKLAFVPTSDASNLSFSSFALDMELKVQAKDQVVISLITFTYTSQGGAGTSLEADLWLAPPFDTNDPKLALLPDFENYAWFEPFYDSKGFPRYLDLAKLVGFDPDTSPPSIFPTAMTMAKIYVDSNAIGIAATLRSVASQNHSKPPIFSIDEIDFAASYYFGASGGGQGGFDIAIGLSALLQPPPAKDIGPAELQGGFKYESEEKQWTLYGSVANLQAAHFYQFFDAEVQDAAAFLLDNIAIKRFNIKYVYAAGQASKLTIGATLGIGSLDLRLDYANDGIPWSWDFLARVRHNPEKAQNSTFRDMLADIVGDDGISIPDFLANINIDLSKEGNEVGLRLVPDKISKKVIFTLWATLGSLRVQYIQFAAADGQNSKTEAPLIKRLFLTSFKGFDFEAPILKKIAQPFDEALAMWVKPIEGHAGITLDEIKIVNEAIVKSPLDQKPLPYKSVKKDPVGTDVVLRNGVHLMLVLKDDQGKTNVALDYVFGATKQDSTEILAGDDDFPTENGDSGLGMYPKTYNGLSVRNLGLKYANSVLSIKVDASVRFGPIDFSLYGFTINFDFSGSTELSLFNLPSPSVSLDGLEAGYNQPPTTVAGLIMHVDNPEIEMYQGALVASFQPWKFSAAGCYGEVKGLESFRTFFVYARLLGPLITFEFATISGVTAGFGYNNSMLFPTAADIMSYPLISVPTPPPDAQSAIRNLVGTKWFSPKQGSFWIAAGLNVTAFELLDVSAVVTVQWDPNVKLGIFAIATAVIPKPTLGKTNFKFAQVQLGMTAVVDFAAGTMKIDGQLTPASFILDPNCHLTGGFALYTWFDDSVPALKGDWVFTIGGYHRQFTPPPQYPRPPRLGISWQFDSAISIRGEAYFAITPKVCMGGGRWDVSLRLGPLEAYYNAYIDFLISFKPFYFIADGGVSVGVRYTMDLWLATIHIRIEISASVHIEGPPIHGFVHVDFWVFGFDIKFGRRGDMTARLTLKEFIELACQSSEPSIASMFHTLTGQTPVIGNFLKPDEGAKFDTAAAQDVPKPHVLVVQEGLVPEDKTETRPSGGDWTVRAANFSFTISCKVAISEATIITGLPATVSETDEADQVPQSIIPGTGNPIHARPMCDPSPISSTLQVNIWADDAKQKLLTNERLFVADTNWNNNKSVVKSLPAGLWGKYDKNTDPRSHANDPAYLNGTVGGTVSLMCGITITVPKPLLSTADTTKPFNYRKFMVQEIDERFDFPILLENNKALLPAKPADLKKQWDEARTAWDMEGKTEVPIELVDLWQEVGLSDLGWDAAKVDAKEDKHLTGRKPAELVRDLEDYYLWAPFVSAGEEA